MSFAREGGSVASRRRAAAPAAALLALLLTAATLLAAPAARAASVLVMGRHGHVSVRTDRFLTANGMPAAQAPRPSRSERAKAFRRPADAAGMRTAVARRRQRKPPVTVLSTLAHLQRAGAISPASYQEYRNDFNAALRSERRLRGTRKVELEAVTENLHNMAVAGALTPSRLPVLFLTLVRNRQWWTTGPLLSYGQRVEFTGSQLAWEYYPGQGIELTALGNFGKADWACKAGSAGHATCQDLLAELIPLAARRAGGLTWEYYFRFDGGAPPWTSAMSQATALAALSDGYRALGDPSLLTVAQEALPVLETAPPAGVAVPTRRGTRFVQYSFAPRASQEVINAFLQTLIGLNTYAQLTGSSTAQQLFAAGNAEALAELPHFDTGAWSLYQPGIEDDLSYHQLVIGFLQKLCGMTATSTYCDTAEAFQQDLRTAPVVNLLTHRLPRKRPATLRFSLSKISHVGIVVLRGSHTVFLTSGSFPYGQHSFALPGLRQTGQYTVRLAATDLAGNFARASFPLTVVRTGRSRSR